MGVVEAMAMGGWGVGLGMGHHYLEEQILH